MSKEYKSADLEEPKVAKIELTKEEYEAICRAEGLTFGLAINSKGQNEIILHQTVNILEEICKRCEDQFEEEGAEY